MTADHVGQTGGERERDWDLAFRFGLAYFGGRLDRGLLNRTDISDMLTNAYRLGREHAPVPVAGQAAREAAASLIAGYAILGRIEPFNLAVLTMSDRDAYLELVDRVAALSAAGGQET